MRPNPDIPHDLVSAQVLARFLLRIVILSICAALGRQGFGKTIEPLLTLATCYCIVVGGIRREAPLGHVLTHYDEAAGYFLGANLAAWIA
jgi:hypothetical protein